VFVVSDLAQNMPRGKNKKKKFSKRPVHQSKKPQEVNPFELKVNRQKHEVLGRKISKTDKGMPGLSRSKAIKKVPVAYNFYLVVVIVFSMENYFSALLCNVLYLLPL